MGTSFVNYILRRTDRDVTRGLAEVARGASAEPSSAVHCARPTLLVATLLLVVMRAALACHAPPSLAVSMAHGQLHRLEEAVDEAVFDNCFLAGTLVAMADGTKKPIEQVHAGDRVKACDPLSGEVVDREVVRTFRNVTDTVVDVTWAPVERIECLPVGQRGRGERHSVGSSRDEGGEDGEPPSAQTVRCTPGHSWWVESQQRWVFAGDLRVGDLLKLDDGRVGALLALEVREEVAQTFNFEVEGLHTYFVGDGHAYVREANALVHNMSKRASRLRRAEGRERRAASAARASHQEVAMDKNALVSAIESPGKDALGALGNRRPVVSPRVREEFLAGSPDLRKRLGDAGARRHQEKVLERFLRKHDGRIGPTPSASAMTPFQVPGVIKGDPHALASAQMEGLRLLTRDKKAIKNFPALTERF